MATKKKVTYDNNVDYQNLMNQAAASGDYSAAAQYERQRNAKIQAEGLGYAQTNNYEGYLPKEYNGVEYDNTTDYMTKLNEALKRGDYASAAQYEKQRNAKIDGEGLGYAKTQYTYTPQYDAQINDLFNKLLNREGFTYNAATDPLYQQYRELYTQQGKLAMQDTMGQAAALTGGYGSSYSQAVGQQQYDAYLQKLNAVIPELYGQAYSQYEAEGDRLKDAYSMLLSKDASDYERAQNNYSRYLQQQATEYERNQAEQQKAASEVTAILQAGGMPSDALIKQSGFSSEYISAMRNYYTQMAAQATSRSAGGGSSSRKSKEEWAAGISTEQDKTKTGAVKPSAWSRTKQTITQLLRSGDMEKAYHYMNQIVDELSESQYKEIVKLFDRYEGRK